MVYVGWLGGDVCVCGMICGRLMNGFRDGGLMKMERVI